MQVLIINSSPRKNKNSFNICNDILKQLRENDIDATIFNIYDMNIEYCTACGYCEKVKSCKFKDDLTPMYDTFDKSIGTIVVSPIHFNSISAKLKTVVDRTQAIYSSKYILKDSLIDRSKKRVGMYIAVGGSKPYDNQLIGGDVVMDFFFKSINTKLSYEAQLLNTDEIPYDQNEVFKQDIKLKINEYINDIKELD